MAVEAAENMPCWPEEGSITFEQEKYRADRINFEFRMEEIQIMSMREFLNGRGRYLFVISSVIFAGMMSQYSGSVIWISMLADLLFLSGFVSSRFWKNIDVENIKAPAVCVSILYSVYYMNFVCRDFMEVQGEAIGQMWRGAGIPEKLNSFFCYFAIMLLAVLALFAVWLFFLLYIKGVLKFGKGLYSGYDRTDKRFLFTSFIVVSGLILIFYVLTNVFYCPANADQTIRLYDAIYRTDSGAVFSENTFISFRATQNDIRQPLFWLFSLPFSLPAVLMSEILFFIPQSEAVCLGMMQAFILINCIILVGKMLKLQENEKTFFSLFMLFSFPSMLFLFTLEQYVLSTFWLLLFFYTFVHRQEGRFIAIAAAGSILTNGVVFCLNRGRTVKEWGKGLFLTGSCFIAVFIAAGQLPKLQFAIFQMKDLMRFTGTGGAVSFSDRVLQYIKFVSTCFFAPSSYINFERVRYQMNDVNSLSIMGIVFLFISIIGYAMNRKKEFAKICAGWIVFSFVLLCVVGWGTVENGLLLYGLYFSWAFLSLAFLAVRKLFMRTPHLQRSIYFLLILFLFIVNSKEIWQILKFGVAFYPNNI